MRTPVTLALLLLTACAASGTPGVDPAWNEIQQHRLERLREPRHPDDAVIALLGRPPRDLTQEPKPATAGRPEPKIDQVLPAVAGTGPRPFRTAAQPITVRASGGIGNVRARSRSSLLDDREQAGFARVAVDSATGAAVDAELWSSGDDLFAGTRINDGVDPADADATLYGVDVFPHVRLDTLHEGPFSMPLRAGLFADWQTLHHAPAGVQRQWIALGPRVVLEPTLRLLGDDDGWLDLVGRIGGDLGAAWFDESFRNGDDGDVTSRWSGELGASLRAQVGRMQAELGYGLHRTNFGVIDTDLFGYHGLTELQRQQAFFGLGIRF
ncbi:MAG: hypothetical protein JNM25_08090 [Planctomycetes bacterium]|nr:hypothetical protein [Planctomycetota bacterium]